METVKNLMATEWYRFLETSTLWFVEFAFFAILIQLSVVILTKIILTSQMVEEITPTLYANITINSILWAVFIKIYMV